MRALSIAALLWVLCACTSGLHSSAGATQVYVLRSAAAAGVSPGSVASLQVGRPLAGPGLDSEHIVVIEPDRRMSYYAGSLWAADLPAVVEALAVQTLRGRGAWSSVSNSESVFPSEYLLQITIRRFEAEYTAGVVAPTARVSFDCVLGRRAGRDALASFTAEGAVVAEQNRVGAVVAAFEQAANAALASVTDQSLAALKTSTSPSPP